ncbi:hypothetical protein BGZ76_007465 [Entomortierella beljakovae]|nr:hypothetical protein BGZ76_007465 [Entomortierella beljakovae]
MAPIFRLAVLATIFTAFTSALPVHKASLQKRAPVSAGTYITQCTEPGTVAITFDDGPHIYTKQLLDNLRGKNAKVTFFLCGQNYGNINEYADVVKAMYTDGHQIASHTYNHKVLTAPDMDKDKIISEMTLLEDAIDGIIGVRPVYMRPPTGAYSSEVLDTLGELNYKVIGWDYDTDDWRHPDDVAASLEVYETALEPHGALSQPGHIFLQHDTLQTTATQLGPEAVDYALSLGYRVVTVGECLGAPQSEWYRPKPTVTY